jgi:isoleucyl-tRNA synthetase
MEDWLNNMGDWCISRKRYWGLPLPFYPCEACGKLTIVGTMDELRELAVSGLDQLRELHRPWIDAVRIRCPDCGAEVERITEVGDCWLDAGIVPFSTLGPGALKDPEEWARWYPADWVSEMREQIRLWFYSMLFMSVALEDRAPYQRVLTYEKLMDQQGRPMHKSLGNAIWFDEAAEKMGADVMRWLYAGQNIQSNLLFGYGPAEEIHRKLLTLWNVYSFYVTYAEAEEFTPAAAPADLPRSTMDRWILSQLQTLVAYARERLDAYDVAALVEAVDRFVDDLSTWYLRRGRRRFSRAADPNDRLAAFATLSECLVTLARVVAPIMPFLAEGMYQNLVRSWDTAAPQSVHLTPYPSPKPELLNEAVSREMELARGIVTLGRAARSEAGIRVRQPLPQITIAAERADLMLSEEMRREIADELNVKRVELAENVEVFAQRVVRPNPRLLGPRLGAKFPEVNRALQAGEYVLRPDGMVAVLNEVLTPDEVAVSLQPHEGQAVAQDLQFQGGLAVALDRTITPELLGEGRVRELSHRVQMMRRDAGLHVEERIMLAYQGSPALTNLILENADRIREEVGAVEVQDVSRSDGRPADPTAWSGTLDGEEITLTIWQVS